MTETQQYTTSPPTQTFRIIRGAKANHKVVFYATKERRDERAQHFADIDGQSVMVEEWTRDTAERCDPINAGWACDGVAEPTTSQPKENNVPETTDLSDEFLDALCAKLPSEDNPIPFASISIEASGVVLKNALFKLKEQGRAEIIYGRGWHRA